MHERFRRKTQLISRSANYFRRLILYVVMSLCSIFNNVFAVTMDEAHGLLIYLDGAFTPEIYAFCTEYSSLSAFPTVNNLVRPNGSSLSVDTKLVLEQIDYDRVKPSAFPDLLQESDASKIDLAIAQINHAMTRFPSSKKFLAPIGIALKLEKQFFQQGQGKYHNKWYPTILAAINERDRPLRLEREANEKALANAKAEAARLETEAKKIFTQEKEKSQAVYADALNLFRRVFDDKSWKDHSNDLSKISSLNRGFTVELEKLLESCKRLENELTNQEPRAICTSACGLLETSLAWGRSSQAFANFDCTRGTSILQNLLYSSSAPRNSDLSLIWNALMDFLEICIEKQGQAGIHIQKARQLAAVGKNGQAIEEYQSADLIFPNAQLKTTIEELRKDSLGL